MESSEHWLQVSTIQLLSAHYCLLQVSTLHPQSCNMLTVTVKVAEGGAIGAEVTVMDGDPPLSCDALITKVLEVSLDIPLAIDQMLIHLKTE